MLEEERTDPCNDCRLMKEPVVGDGSTCKTRIRRLNMIDSETTMSPLDITR